MTAALVLLCAVLLTATPRHSGPRDAFMRQTGHPHGWPGHVVDHVIPLARGGCDCPENMQFQTTAEGKAKDRWEMLVPVRLLLRKYGRGQMAPGVRPDF